MDQRSKNFTRAFARQAESDFEIYKKLCGITSIPNCHRLLFLQMCCEKLSKAYLCGAGSSKLEDLQSSHAYTGNTFRLIARQLLSRKKLRQVSDHGFMIRRIGDLAREIELLSPAVEDGGKRPDNCEYPWEWEEGRGNYTAPADYAFPNISQLLKQPAGVFLLKELLPSAIEDLK